jgi:hypothetical protein
MSVSFFSTGRQYVLDWGETLLSGKHASAIEFTIA